MLTKQPSPLIISKNGKVKSLEMLIKTHKEFNEKYLQELLVQHPELLRINDGCSGIINV